MDSKCTDIKFLRFYVPLKYSFFKKNGSGMAFKTIEISSATTEEKINDSKRTEKREKGGVPETGVRFTFLTSIALRKIFKVTRRW